MTQNQLRYWELQENIRKNKANEALTASDIDVKSHHYERSDTESQRHNIQDELLTAKGITQRAVAAVKDVWSLGSTLLLGDQAGLDLSPETMRGGMVRLGETGGTIVGAIPDVVGSTVSGFWSSIGLDKVTKGLTTVNESANDSGRLEDYYRQAYQLDPATGQIINYERNLQ